MKPDVSVGGVLRERVARHRNVLVRHSDRFIDRVIRAETVVLAAELERDAALGRISIDERDSARTELAVEVRRLSREVRGERALYWARLPTVH